MEGTLRAIPDTINTPTIRIVGPQLYDDVIVRAAWKASERIWKELGVLVLVEYENTGLADHLAGVGLSDYEPRILVHGSGGFEEIKFPSIGLIDEEELARTIQREVIRRLAESDVVIEVSASIAGEGREGLHGLAGA